MKTSPLQRDVTIAVSLIGLFAALAFHVETTMPIAFSVHCEKCGQPYQPNPRNEFILECTGCQTAIHTRHWRYAG